MCVDRNQLCSVIEYTGNNCTLWKYVLFAENAWALENLYLKDVDNKFKNSDCVQKNAVTDLGKKIQKLVVNLQKKPKKLKKFFSLELNWLGKHNSWENSKNKNVKEEKTYSCVCFE